VTPRREPDSSSPASPVTPLTDEAVAPERLMAELANVQVAHEELRVAEEEMRVQRDQITELLVQHDTERRWRGQLSALVPVGLCVTDGNGTVVEANPAMAARLGTGRSTLRLLGSGRATEHRLPVKLKPRGGDLEPAQLFGFGEAAAPRASAARVQWILVPDAGQTPRAAGRAGEPVEEDGEAAFIPETQVVSLVASLAQLAALPVGEHDRQRLLSRMAMLVRGAVPGADWVSITIGSPLEPQRLGTDSSEAQLFDGRQMQAGEGPCWAAYALGAVVTSDDVTTDSRWPALVAVCAADAVRSAVAVPVREDGTCLGVVNVYSGRPRAFGSAGRRIAELAGAAVAGVLQNVTDRESLETLASNLERALTSRAVIDQAKGVIMARLGVGPDDAFARLVDVSSRLNVKVRDLAALVVEGHADAVLQATDKGR
jgi:putative methionine-R-sulfoxide reductase with GAF domain/PAS domain-containing protein